MGFTTADLKTMPLSRLMWFIHCNNENNDPDSRKEPEFREGTIAELKSIL